MFEVASRPLTSGQCLVTWMLFDIAVCLWQLAGECLLLAGMRGFAATARQVHGWQLSVSEVFVFE